jgi:hypothetical protein
MKSLSCKQHAVKLSHLCGGQRRLAYGGEIRVSYGCLFDVRTLPLWLAYQYLDGALKHGENTVKFRRASGSHACLLAAIASPHFRSCTPPTQQSSEESFPLSPNENFSSCSPSSFPLPSLPLSRITLSLPSFALIRFHTMESGLGSQATLAKIDKLRELNVGSIIPLPQVCSRPHSAFNWLTQQLTDASRSWSSSATNPRARALFWRA